MLHPLEATHPLNLHEGVVFTPSQANAGGVNDPLDPLTTPP